MKPTEHTAKPTATPKTGRFATLRGLQAQGNGAPARGLVAAPLVALCVLLALCVGLAEAEPPKLVSYGAFHSGGTGIAVDQSSGDVFTASSFPFEENCTGHCINKFDMEGKLISPPSPFAGGSFYGGAAVNPVNRNLDVLNSESLETYDSTTGNLISSFSVPPSRDFLGLTKGLVQIATDSAGNVYVPIAPENEVLEYSSSGVLLETFKGSGSGTLKEPLGVVIDSSGDLWVADTGDNRIEELSSTGAPLGEVKSEGVTSVALGREGAVYALVVNTADPCGSTTPPCPHLVEYSSTGAQVADVGAGTLEGFGFYGALNMVASDASTGRVYVTDDFKSRTWIFGPPTAPEVVNELAAEVTTSDAKLGALVNPGGSGTSYRFEYGTTTAYGYSTPFPEGSAGEGVKGRTVWASANGLAPGTTYHYRVVASNEVGTVVGLDRTFTTETGAEIGCANEQLRDGFSARLPDCRAYEMVTQPNSSTAQPDSETSAPHYTGGGIGGNLAAPDGERLSYESVETMPGANSDGADYLATRGPDGWTSENLTPLQSYDGDRCPSRGEGNVVVAYSSNLAASVLRVGAAESYGDSTFNGGCGAEGFEVVQGEPLGMENLLLRDNTTGTYQLIDSPPAGAIPTDARFFGASDDISHVVFSETARLTANAPAGAEDLYEWDEGALRLLTVLPNGAAAVGSLPDDPTARSSRSSVVSTEGARVFFTVGDKLYVRVNGEETVQVDEARGGPGPGGGGSFQDATPDGTQAFFTDDASAGLTSDTVAGSGANLYRYASGRLSDLTAAGHAEVVDVIGIGEDGSYVYFVANGALSGSQANERGQTAQSGEPNLYLWHGGTTTFIATLEPADEALEGAARVSPGGTYMAFSSKVSLTGYDNIDADGGLPDPEVFLYSATSNQLTCASCNPSGEPPSSGTSNSYGGATLSSSSGAPQGATPHYLSDGGRVLFQTREALLPSDTNGQMDVYEYEQGQLHLISSGTSAKPSILIDASEEGNDVFFLSHQPLVEQDHSPEALVIYDARVGGGFPESLSPPACTTADACRAPVSLQPSIYGAPSSQTFSGAGNLAPAVGVAKKAKPTKAKTCKHAGNRRDHAACKPAQRKHKHRNRKAKSHKEGK